MLEWINKLNSSDNVKKYDFLTLICYYVLVFFVGAVAGFIYEEIFYLVVDGVLKKSGFLYGFYLPVYGFGAVLMVFLLKRFKKNPLVIFLLSIVITGVVEYFTGILLWELFHRTWWDYQGLFLNIGGYVCLRSVVSFAIGGLLLVYVAEPLINKFINRFDKERLIYCSCFIVLVIIVDLMFTLNFRNTL